MRAQVITDFFLDLAFHEREKQPQSCLDVNDLGIDFNAAVRAGALKMNKVAFPAVVNLEFFREIFGQFIGCMLRVFKAHCMARGDIDIGHGFALADPPGSGGDHSMRPVVPATIGA